MSRRIGIVSVLGALALVVALEWAGGRAPNPYAAPDPLAWGSKSGASGAICTFAPGAK